ncbi:MAG: STAS-like domain-containing protein [Candidatus Aegiribacteria sp.]|nr:STAS-like domain-containing protein [Candidatus Aegiribacteria sp.]
MLDNMDIHGVRSLGQAFSDEIFRVYANAHPEMKISVKNLTEELKPIIQHVSPQVLFQV